MVRNLKKKILFNNSVFKKRQKIYKKIDFKQMTKNSMRYKKNDKWSDILEKNYFC